MESSASEQLAVAALVPANAISDESVQRALEAVLSSSTFREAEILKRFLRYIVEQTLVGHGDLLKEYKVGLEVFGRDPSFDPRLDPAVRMAARRLRSKLSEYYEHEGRRDGLRIDVPKGGYAASFTIPPREPLSLESSLPATPSPRPDAPGCWCWLCP